MDDMLEVDDLRVRYGSVIAVRGLSFTVGPGRILALTGPNGAGKSTTVMSIVGGTESATSTGSIRYGGRELLGADPEAIARLGISCVPEGRRIITTLTVEENLIIASGGSRSRRSRSDFDEIYSRFPALEQYRRKTAGLLSGGQLQQLALGRALVRRPSLLVIDEPSIGLSPNLVTEVFAVISGLRDEGTAIVLVEQNSIRATALADDRIAIDKGTAITQPHPDGRPST